MKLDIIMQDIKLKTALFDFDGVIVDSEPIYDVYWNEASERYGLNIKDFASSIKGTTMPYILKKYFSQFSEEFRQMVLRESMEFDQIMPLPPVKGALEFLETLKKNGIAIGLVTSSDNAKVQRAFNVLNLHNMFDTVVTADRITRGKPDPMCYQLAAADLNISPEDCLVFEDSFAGVEAATQAGMRIIGLSTTNPEKALKDKVYKVIPDFSDSTFEDYKRWCK